MKNLQSAVDGAQCVNFPIAASEVGRAVRAQGALRLNATTSFEFPIEFARAACGSGWQGLGTSRRDKRAEPGERVDGLVKAAEQDGAVIGDDG